MRVNVYAEEMTDRVEIISKEIEGQKFTGLRLYLELPVSVPEDFALKTRPQIVPSIDTKPTPTYLVPTLDPTVKRVVFAGDAQAVNLQGPFIHHPGDDDSSAVTFWGKRDLRLVLRKMLAALDAHYGDRS